MNENVRWKGESFDVERRRVRFHRQVAVPKFGDQVSLLRKRTLAAGAGIVVAMTGSLFAFSSPASADYSCPAKQVCFFQDKDGHGSPATLAGLVQGGGGVANFSDHKFHNGVNLNDQASSVFNNTNQYLGVYEHTTYGGRWQRVKPYGWANFGGDVKNDTASSARFVDAGCTPPEWCV